MTPLRFSLICSTCSTSDLMTEPFPFPFPFPLPLPLRWGSTGWKVVIGSGVVALAAVVVGITAVLSWVGTSGSEGAVCSAAFGRARERVP